MERTLDEYDVVISGYGPTGLAAASLIARRGHRVCVFERWPSLYGQPRMATIDGESARIIQAAGDIAAAMRNSVPRRRYLFASADAEVLIENRWDFDHICGFPFRISLHQPDVEDAMDAAARKRGAEINQGWEVRSLDQGKDFATVLAQECVPEVSGATRRGRTRTVRTKYVIGADGARSTVRGQLGIEREQWPFRNAWLSFDALRKRVLPNIRGISPDGQTAVIFCAPEGRAHSIIPLGTRHIRFNLEVDPDADHSDKLNDQFAYRFLQAVYGLTADDVQVYRHAVYPFEGRLAKDWRVGRTFLAGDAAHLMTPFLGQGGCSALRDAINLAWKLDLVLRGLAPEALLDTYELERKPHVRVHIDGSDRIAALAFVHDPVAAAERDRSLRNADANPLPREPILNGGILDHHNPHPLVGDIGPQGRVSYGGRTDRLDDLFGWGFQLIGWEHDPSRSLDRPQRGFIESIGGVIAGVMQRPGDDLAVDIDDAYGRFFARHAIAAVLMRPDFYIFGVARRREDVPRLVDSLRRQLGMS
jgi:3-(3-hydroxy-phenyl)propionate hydroxylase